MRGSVAIRTTRNDRALTANPAVRSHDDAASVIWSAAMTADPSDGTAALRSTSVKPGRPSLARTLLAFIVAPVVASLSVAALFTAVSSQGPATSGSASCCTGRHAPMPTGSVWPTQFSPQHLSVRTVHNRRLETSVLYNGC